jgi:MFS transporter, AAHS family, 4-hydroxybenzoate transporter
VAYEALAGTLPHTADNALALAMEKNAKPPRPLTEVAPHVPAAAAAALMRGLDKDPGQRFQSCCELARAFAAGLTAPASPAHSTVSAEPAAAHRPSARAAAIQIAERADVRSASQEAVTIDVDEFIDARPVGSFQIRVLLLCAAVLFIVGYDTQAVGYVAPELQVNLGLARSTVELVFSSGLFGLILGALLLGPLADRLGRKRVILISTIGFGVCTLLTAVARDGASLLALRFLTGVGLGGAMPSAIALTAEFSPRRRRATMVMAMLCGLSLGATSGGVIAAALIPAHDWQAVFFAGGVLALALTPLLGAALPESVRLLALRGTADGKVRDVLRRMASDAAVPADARFSVREIRSGGTPIAHLFSAGRGLVTLLFWIVFLTSLLGLALLSSWLPMVFGRSRGPILLGASIATLFQAGGIGGALALGSFIDRRSFRALGFTFLVAALSVAGIGYASGSTLAVALVVFCAGFSLVGAEIAANALAATYYPTPIRSTGVGWALGIGRIGSIVGAPIVGVLLSYHIADELLFLVAAIPIVGAALTAFAISRLAAVARPD